MEAGGLAMIIVPAWSRNVKPTHHSTVLCSAYFHEVFKVQVC